jgi:hypothetical protein
VYSLSILVWNDKSLWPWPIASARPEEGVNAVSVVIKVYDKKRVGVDSVDIASDLVVIRIEFSYKFPPIGPVLVILLAVDCKCGKTHKERKS